MTISEMAGGPEVLAAVRQVFQFQLGHVVGERVERQAFVVPGKDEIARHARPVPVFEFQPELVRGGDPVEAVLEVLYNSPESGEALLPGGGHGVVDLA